MQLDRASGWCRAVSLHRGRVRSLVSQPREQRPSDVSLAVDRLDAALEKYFASNPFGRTGNLNSDAAGHPARVFGITDEIRKLNGENLDARKRPCIWASQTSCALPEIRSSSEIRNTAAIHNPTNKAVSRLLQSSFCS
jgi:hypothetical protein